ncbi:MAG: ATP-binding protein [Campylobacterales bacterium]
MIESILLEDNQHWTNHSVYDKYIPRAIVPQAMQYLNTKEIVAIIGARRVGKSTLAKLLIKNLIQEQSIDSKQIFFINLEKPEFIPYKSDSSYLQVIFDEYLKLANPNKEQKIYFFIDEIQIFENWELFIKSKYEALNVKFIITGSNSSLLTSNYATALTGRVLRLQLDSFSFQEFLEFKNIPYKTALERTQYKIDIQRYLDEYLQWGGYYSVISNDDEMIKKEYLRQIAEDIILKDIVPRYNIKNSSAIKDLFYYLVSNTTTLITYSSLAKKINIDPKMIKEYIGYFEDNFLIATIPQYHNKLTAQITSSKKLYLNDNGFLNIGINRSSDKGKRLENLVFIELYKQDKELTFLKDTYECDFYTQNTLYQVTTSIEDESVRKRELRSFGYFFKNENKKNILIVQDAYNLMHDQYENVEIIPLYQWLLDGY